MIGSKILLSIIFSIIYLIVVGYIDFELVTPLFPLPNDICYYHLHTPPTWVRLFYLDNMGHIEPPFSGLHVLILFIISCVLGVTTAIRTVNYRIKKRKEVPID